MGHKSSGKLDSGAGCLCSQNSFQPILGGDALKSAPLVLSGAVECKQQLFFGA